MLRSGEDSLPEVEQHCTHNRDIDCNLVTRADLETTLGSVAWARSDMHSS